MDNMVFGIRLSGEEKKLINRAAAAGTEPGDRGGASSWARKVLLREAKRVLGCDSDTLNEGNADKQGRHQEDSR